MIVDANLVARLESSAASLAVALATASSGATSQSFVSGALVALGPGRYVNRAIGVGSAAVVAADLDELETFFIGCGVAPSIEVCSWASPSLVALLASRHYEPQWFSNVYARTATSLDAPPLDDVAVQAITDDTVDEWRRTLAAGNEVGDDERVASDEFATAAHALPGATDLPTGASARNLARAGFTHAYTQLVMTRPPLR